MKTKTDEIAEREFKVGEFAIRFKLIRFTTEMWSINCEDMAKIAMKVHKGEIPKDDPVLHEAIRFLMENALPDGAEVPAEIKDLLRDVLMSVMGVKS